MRALLIGNGDDPDDLDPGFVGARLQEQGYEFVAAHRERPGDWPSLDAADLVVTLGSVWNVYRDETADLVEAEAALVREVSERGVPLLAICFGGQVVAQALGGAVSRAPTPEIGWFELQLTAEGLAGALPEGVIGPWMEWHSDVFTVPGGFTELARTDAGPQLLRTGRILATQFHPEATEAMVTRWLAASGAEQYRRHGGDPDELRDRTAANVLGSEPRARALVDWFLNTVAQPA